MPAPLAIRLSNFSTMLTDGAAKANAICPVPSVIGWRKGGLELVEHSAQFDDRLDRINGDWLDDVG